MTTAARKTLPRGYDAWIAVVRNYQKCHRALARALDPLDLSVAQHDALAAIGRSEGLTQQALADRLLVVKSNVAALVKRLEARALLRRRPDPADARSNRLHLTRTGRELLRRSLAAQAGVIETMSAVASDAELARSENLNLRIGAALDALLRDD
ncbi:MAG: MarR family transcriptional regulator [Pseudomonadota bacterium]